MKIKIDCDYVTGRFVKDVCLVHSKGDKVEKCDGKCDDYNCKEKKK